MRNFLKRVASWLRSNIWIVLIVVVLAANGALIYYNFLSPAVSIPIQQPTVPTSTIPPGMTISPLNGSFVPEAVAATRPFAVMIDNLVPARPSAGLSEASIVWETLVEGGVTRLMPIFQTANDVVIGPVRSARDYYLPWEEDASAVYVHSGGSPAGLAALQANPEIPDANEFSNGGSFYRVPGIDAPHDLFTSIGRLTALAVNKGWNSLPALAPIPSDATTASGDAAKKITINFSTPDYRVQWAWDNDAKLYRRVVGGLIAEDRNTRQQLTAKNVIVLFTDVTQAPPPAPTVAVVVRSVGSGDAWVFRDGVVIKGTWVKPSATDRVVFKNKDGTLIPITPGQVWMEVVRNDKADSVVIQ